MNLIVALSENHVIGKNGKMPWHLPKDLQFFKQETMGHTVVMGRNTFESIGKPLKGRRNIVLSRTLTEKQGIEIARNWDEVLVLVATDEQVFIIGGEQVFREALERKLPSFAYITRIHAHFDGDTFFPPLPPNDWQLLNEHFEPADAQNPYNMTFQVWKRR